MSDTLATDAEIAFILPLYNKFAYAKRAALSFFKYADRPALVIAVDDASPAYAEQDWEVWLDGIPRDRLVFRRFTKNEGLTRSWNWGLRKARELKIPYTICGNSDVLFTPGWAPPLIHQLEEGGYHLIAPVTNAPGPTNAGRQRVANYFPNYHVDDDPAYLAQVASYLSDKYPMSTVVGPKIPINGFFMMAKTETWWEGSFDDDHVFDYRHRMTKNEDELQKRWHKKGWRTGFTPASFVFHYRAVSRGDKFKHHGWLRLEKPNQPV